MTPASTQTRRRMLFGSSAVVASVAAIALAVALNAGLFWQLAAAPQSVRRFTRLDWSATRAHTLAPRSSETLAELSGSYEMIALLAGPSTGNDLDAVRRRSINDLLEVYATGSGHLHTHHIDVTVDPAAATAVQAEVAARFADETAGARETLLKTAEQITKLAGQLQPQRSVIATGKGDYAVAADLMDARTAATTFSDLQRTLDRLANDTRHGLTQPMPDLNGLRINGWNEIYHAIEKCKLAHILLERIRPLHGHAHEAHQSLAQWLVNFEHDLGETYALLRALRPTSSYEQARLALAGGESIVLLGPNRARVVPMNLLWRSVENGDQTDTARLVGEEQITGALISLSLPQPPRAVFLLADAGTALDHGDKKGLYSYVADRLRAGGFEVFEAAINGAQWPSGLPPAAPGQKTAWITLPFLEPKPEQGANAPGLVRQRQTADFVQQQLKLGDSALIMLGNDPYADPARLKAADLTPLQLAQRQPLVNLLSQWGIQARPHEVLAHEEQSPGDPPKNVVPCSLVSFANHPVSESLRGLAFHVEKCFRIEPEPGSSAVPLLRLDLPRLWAMGFDNLQPTGAHDFDPAREVASASIAAAAAQGPARLIAVGDPLWASNYVTTYGTCPDRPAADPQGAVLQPGGIAAWPGNAEFFTQSLCWLTHEDRLLSPGARSQDLRRIEPMSDAARKQGIWLLAVGQPLLALLLGLIVWWSRRRF